MPLEASSFFSMNFRSTRLTYFKIQLQITSLFLFEIILLEKTVSFYKLILKSNLSVTLQMSSMSEFFQKNDFCLAILSIFLNKGSLVV